MIEKVDDLMQVFEEAYGAIKTNMWLTIKNKLITKDNMLKTGILGYVRLRCVVSNRTKNCKIHFPALWNANFLWVSTKHI